MSAEILEGESQLVFHMFVDASGYIDAATVCQGLQSRRNIDTVPEYLVAINHHVADVDANSKLHSMPLWQVKGPFAQITLYFNRGSYSLNGARKFGHYTVARAAKDSAAVLSDQLRNCGETDAERDVRALLIDLHEGAVADNVGGQDRGQSAFHSLPSA
jgi:hypothetical protein